jgi:hypothetical protein
MLHKQCFDVLCTYLDTNYPNVTDGWSIKLLIVSEIKRTNIIFRSHTSFASKQAWQDWVMVAWEVDNDNVVTIDSDNDYQPLQNDNFVAATNLIPANIKLFFRCEHDIEFNAIIHSAANDPVKHSVLSIRWRLEYTNEPKNIQNINSWNRQHLMFPNHHQMPVHHVVSCASIQSHALIIPFCKNSNTVLQIIDPQRWPKAFSSS